MYSGSWSLGGLGVRGLRLVAKHAKSYRQKRVNSSSSDARSTTDISKVSSGLNPVLKAALISGSLSLTGDLVAQLLVHLGSGGHDTSPYDPVRAARMGSYGFVFYGPYQHYWYNALDNFFKSKTVQNYATKVFLNQVALGPVVISTVFAWTLAWQNKLGAWPQKMENDFVTTMVTGWKFWVPASTINFVFVPLQHQVLYMSCCGIVWTAFLSYSSAKRVQEGVRA